MIRRVTRDDPRPLYKQVKSHILEALDSGEIPARSKLASERELVDALGVSRITVRQAMKELVLEGHILSQPGKGFYAAERALRRGYELELLRSFTETARAHGRVPGTVLLAAETLPAPEPVAEALDLPAGASAFSLERLRLLDGRPVAISRDWLAVRLAPGLAGLDWSVDNLSLYGELRSRYGVVPHHGQTILGAAMASAEQAHLLRLSPPAAVLTVEQIAYDATGRPINLTYTTHEPAIFPLRLEQGPSGPR